MCGSDGILALQGAGAANSAIGAAYGAQEAKNALEYQSAIAEVNARVAKSGADSILAAGQKTEQAVRLQTAALKSKQVAAFAANGIDLGSGSAQRVLTSTDLLGEIDANTVTANAVRQAFGYKVQVANYGAQAAGAAAGAASISPFGAGASSALTGATAVAESWYKFNRASVVTPGDGGVASSLGSWYTNPQAGP